MKTDYIGLAVVQLFFSLRLNSCGVELFRISTPWKKGSGISTLLGAQHVLREGPAISFASCRV